MCEEECEPNPKPRPKPNPSSTDVAERGVASIGVRSSGNLCVEYVLGEASLGSGYSETNNGFRYLIAHALNRPIDSPHEPHGQASVNQGVAIFVGMRPFSLCASTPHPALALAALNR